MAMMHFPSSSSLSLGSTGSSDGVAVQMISPGLHQFFHCLTLYYFHRRIRNSLLQPVHEIRQITVAVVPDVDGLNVPGRAGVHSLVEACAPAPTIPTVRASFLDRWRIPTPPTAPVLHAVTAWPSMMATARLLSCRSGSQARPGREAPALRSPGRWSASWCR